MCGRFNQKLTSAELSQVGAELGQAAALPPSNYNVAPTQRAVAITGVDPRMAGSYRWGLIPFWAKDAKIGSRMFNARAETVATKPAFRAAFRGRRCIVPASGFYEWKRVGSRKEPQYIYRTDGEIMGFAGLWESWSGPKGEEHDPVESFSILTTEPNAQLREIHDRMPVILEKSDWDAWLDPNNKDLDALQSLLRPAAEGRLTWHEVDPGVGNPRNNGPQLIEPYSPDESR